MSYRIAGIDVHKKMLAVVVSEVEIEGAYEFERRMFGSSPDQLRSLAAWLLEQEVEEVVMESTAQYWKPVWEALERYWKPLREKREGASRRSGTLHLAQAQSNRGPRGRKKDFRDAERLVKRLVARELTLSFVPDAEQRLWRTVTRRKYQLTRDHVRLQNQVESLLEEAHIKLSSFVSDLLGASARRMLKALAEGETNPAALAALADRNLRATPEQLCDVRLAPGTQSSHWGHRPSTVSANLVDPASGSPLRRTGPSGHQTIEATPHFKDASATPKPRLSDRTTQSSTQPSTSAVIFDPE